ncbi:MAG: TetR/AcrR family transcriptional regulator, partial [Thermomicrobiales bacterium]
MTSVSDDLNARKAVDLVSRDKRRRGSAETTETRIVRAAENIFAKKGYFDATVEDIVYRAKVSRGTFYLYFKNKDDVFKRVVSTMIDALFTMSSTQSKGTLRERVESGNRRYLEVFYKNRELMRALFQVATVLPEIAALHNELRRKFIERIKRHLD